MTPQAVGHPAPPVRAFALFQELPNCRIVPQRRRGSFRRDDMADAAGPRAGRAKNELAMGLVQRADRDGSQHAPMLGVTGETVSLPTQDLRMGRSHLR